MAMRRRKSVRRTETWIAAGELPQSPGHVFYENLNGFGWLPELGFDTWVEERCLPHDAKMSRPGISPGVDFRILLIGYFEGLGAQQGMAWQWRCFSGC